MASEREDAMRSVLVDYQLMEPDAPYKANFDPKNDLLSLDNTYIWGERG